MKNQRAQTRESSLVYMYDVEFENLKPMTLKQWSKEELKSFQISQISFVSDSFS